MRSRVLFPALVALACRERSETADGTSTTVSPTSDTSAVTTDTAGNATGRTGGTGATGETGLLAGATGDTGIGCGGPQANPRRIEGALDLTVAAEAHLDGSGDDLWAGISVAGVGDLTGDDLPDIAVGSASGRVYLFPGPVSGELKTRGDAFILGEQLISYGQFGIAAFDADGDGEPDLAAYGDYSEVAVVLGPITGDVDVSQFAFAFLSSPPFGHNIGYAMQPAGDLSGDGMEDLFLGGDTYNAAFLLAAGSVTGGDQSYEDIALLELHAAALLVDSFGSEVAARGDQDADGVGDLLVGSDNDGPLGAGAFYVFDGALTGWADSTAATATLYTTITGNLGDLNHLDFAGDVNGDGYDDMLVGREDGGYFGRGTIYLVHGPVSGTMDVATVAAAEIVGVIAAQTVTVERAGDLDGDGFGDYASGGINDTVYVFYGPGPAGFAEATLTADAILSPGGTLGSSMDDVGDIDGDCYPDLLIGAPFTGGGGEAWLVRGGYL